MTVCYYLEFLKFSVKVKEQNIILIIQTNLLDYEKERMT